MILCIPRPRGPRSGAGGQNSKGRPPPGPGLGDLCMFPISPGPWSRGIFLKPGICDLYKIVISDLYCYDFDLKESESLYYLFREHAITKGMKTRLNNRFEPFYKHLENYIN